MPTLVFVIMYISGVLLAFLSQSLFKAVRLPMIARVVLFMKVKIKSVYLHVLIFQIVNILFFCITAYFVITDSERAFMMYNIYIKVSAALLLAVLFITAVDAHILETRRPPKGKINEKT